jgi:hypothetical protein
MNVILGQSPLDLPSKLHLSLLTQPVGPDGELFV